jgi:hypothetical protein
MSSTFVVLMHLGAIRVYLPAGSKAIPYVHAPFQIFTACLAITGLIPGVLLCSLDEYSEYYPIDGYVIVSPIVLVGLLHHLLFRRNGKKTILGNMHRRLGRAAIMLGMTNGGLGFRFAGSDNVPKESVVVYSVFAAVFGLSYTGFVIWQSSKIGATDPIQTKERSSYDSQHSVNDNHYNWFQQRRPLEQSQRPGFHKPPHYYL